MPLGQTLKKFAESHGNKKTCEFIDRAVAEKKIVPEQVRLRELAESIVGPNWSTILPKARYGQFREAQEAVDSSQFAAITGQLLINKVKEGYAPAKMIVRNLFGTEPIVNGNLGTQIEPWLSDVVDGPSVVQQGMPYPRTNFVPNYLTLPAPVKIGEICQITFEMIFSDLTKQAMDRAYSVGKRCRIDEEEQCIKVVVGITNNHIWNGTSYNTYLSVGAWANTISGVQITDWTGINTLEQLESNMVDPNTGKPIDVEFDALLCTPAKYYSLKHAIHATQIATGDIAALPGNQVVGPNPLDKQYPIFKSKFLYQMLTKSVASGGLGLTPTQANEYVFAANFAQAFAWRQVYPLTVVEAPPQNPLQFEQDVMLAVKASLYGCAATRDPRMAYLTTNT